MTQDYKYDNALINYIQGICDLKDLMENTKNLEGRTNNLLLSLIYCHAISLLEAFIGDKIRFSQCRNGGIHAVKEKSSYQNRLLIELSLKKEYGITTELPENYDYMLKKRNYIIHRNGMLPNGKRVVIKTCDVRELISFVKEWITTIDKKITEIQASKLIKKQK